MVKSQRVFASIEGWLLIIGLFAPSNCFAPLTRPSFLATGRASTSLSSTVEVDDAQVENDAVVRSPLRFLGPYPTMPLRFPNLATSSQRERNVTGVSLDWVLDTAANTNTINLQVANELQLEKVGEAPGGVGAAGGISGGDTFMLGDCELDLPKIPSDETDGASDEADDDAFTFMQGLTASALPVASPAAAGLLGLAFFYCFEGGVEFNWGLSKEDGAIPSVTFYGSDDGLDLGNLVRVPFESLPVSMLPSVTISINGKEIPALFDTGSPITVLNKAAAKEAGIETIIPTDESSDDNKGGWNPFSKLASNIKSAQEMAQAAARGEILTIAGTDGKPARLVKSMSQESVHIKASAGEHSLASAQVYVGDLPGLAALGGLGGDAPPAAVLGMDLISTRPRVLFRARQNEIYL